MPLYTLLNKETDEREEVSMTIAERDEFLSSNPHFEQLITKAPSIGDSVRLGIRRTPDSFQDVLKKAKNAHRHSTIETR